MTTLFRYPGGKNKLKELILPNIGKKKKYCEPFFGGGSIFFHSASMFGSATLNDKDENLMALWEVIFTSPEPLKKKILSYKPKTKDFFTFKERLLQGDYTSDLQRAFEKLVIHQISFSGLGTKSGSPLGGKEQKSAYKIDCRWSPKTIVKNIDKIKHATKNCIINTSSLSFDKVLKKCDNETFVYLDPPYYEKGKELYQFSMEHREHEQLSIILKNADYQWLLSYDDAPEIRELYSWAKIKETDKINYSITANKRKKRELLISP